MTTSPSPPPHTTRRAVLAGAASAGLASAALPRYAIAQADQRPSLVVAVQKIANTGTLDPLREQSSNASERYVASIMETPIGRNQQGKLERVPQLAAAWRRVDERTVELDLRPGVRFHDGTPMTAESVAWSFGPERMFGPAPGAAAPAGGKELPADVVAIARRHWPALERVEVAGPLTVRFVNRTPDLAMEGRLGAGGSEVLSPAAYAAAGSWADHARRPVGTGPYRIESFRGDRDLLLVAHDQYWGGRPPLRQVRFVEVPEAAGRVEGLLAGEYHLACDIQPDQIETIERNPRYQVVGGLVPNHRIVNFDRNHPALRDPRVRLAMAHAVDGQALVDALWAGRSRVPPGLQWEFYGPMFVDGWTVPPTDPGRARALLKEAGYKGDPIPYRIRNNYYPAEVVTAQALVEMWRDAGLNVALEVDENWSQVLDRSRGPRGLRDWSNSATFDDPVSSIVNQHGPNGAQQQVGEWTNEEMNRLCPELESGTDPARRKQAFARMLRICEREDPAYVVLHQNAAFTAKRRDLPWQATPSFFVDLSPRNWGKA